MHTLLGVAEQRFERAVARAEDTRPLRVDILGVGVSTLSLPEVVDDVVRWATAPRSKTWPHYVCATSVHGLVEAARDSTFRQVLNRAARVTPDGMPLVWFGRLRGARGMTRVYGPDLMKEVCHATAGRPVRHFFYGGAPGVPEELARRLGAEFPGLQVGGVYSPPYRPLLQPEFNRIAELINGSECQIVWVGLSTPKQERWIAAIRPLLRARVVLSVGAAFDFHTGRVPQAPAWMQASGLEWLFRLSQEPRRLWRRYAYNNPVFMWLALLQLAGLRKFTNVTETE